MIVVRGDACESCGTETNIEDITKWVGTALEKIVKVDGGKFRLGADQGVIVLAFTRNKPQGMDKIIEALQDKFSGSDVPIIGAWRVGDTVYYECIGNCNGLSEEDQRRIACEHVGGSCDNVQEYGGANPSSNSSEPTEDSVTVSPAPLVDDPSECPPGMTCMLSTED